MAGAHSKASVAKSPSVEALNCEALSRWQDLLGGGVTDNVEAGHTGPELSNELNIPRDRLRKLLLAGVQDGSIICTKALRTDICGRTSLVPVYILQTKGKKK